MVRKCVVLLSLSTAVLLLLTCSNGQQSPFQVQDTTVNLIMENSIGQRDAHTVTDTVENNVLIGMIGYLPINIDSVKVTIGMGVETDTMLTYLKATLWTDTQWIKITFHSTGTRTLTVNASIQGLVKTVIATIVVVGRPIAISTQPQSQTVTAGQSVTFSVTATGTAPLSYQWSLNGTAISGATSSSYTISNVQAANAGTYTVTISNGTLPNATSNGAVLIVTAAPVAPSILVQPQSQTVMVGGSVTFNVTATGTAALSYQWSLNGTEISGATSSSYSIPNVQTADAGTYTVTVSNGTLPDATSSGATLTVSAAPIAPTITAQPQSQSVTAGQSVTFSVTATGTVPLSYQWSQNGVVISGATSSAYSIPSVQAANAGTYTVTISNGTLPNATSIGAALTVTAAPVAPTITAQPQPQTVTAGASVTFGATATGTAPLAYQWYLNGNPISGATSSSYIISNVQPANAGTYTVTVSNGISPNATSNGAALTVNVSPSITAQPKSQTVMTYASVTFSVTATGTAPLSYQWSLNGTAISGATSSSYTISNVQAANAGTYTVLVSNGISPNATSIGAMLTVNPLTATDIDGNIYHTVTIGTQVWMVENLKTTRYNNGTVIPLVKDSAAWAALTIPGYCWYNDSATYGNTYGALYNFYAVNTGKLAPTGWHVPTDSEWSVLTTYLGGDSVAGGPLKEAGTVHWASPNTGATNSTGFTALPGGYRMNDGAFVYIGLNGYWWSSTYDGPGALFYREMSYDTTGVHRSFADVSFSVRCIKNP